MEWHLWSGHVWLMASSKALNRKGERDGARYSTTGFGGLSNRAHVLSMTINRMSAFLAGTDAT